MCAKAGKSVASVALNRRVLFGWAVFALAVSLTPTAAVAQAPANQQFVPYQLRVAQATEVVPQLRTMLAGVASNSEILVDRQQNRILLQGPSEAHRVLEQLLDVLDREVLVAQRTPPVSSVVKAYRVPDKQLDSIAQQWQQRYSEEDQFRVVLDQRTQQLIVAAPADIHSELAKQLGQTARPQSAPSQHLPTQDPGQYKLRHISWQALEDALKQLWSEQLQIQTARNGELAIVQLPGDAGQQATMRIDRRYDRVDFEGSDQAAAPWHRAVRALDRPRNTARDHSEFVPVARTDPARIQQVVDMIRSASARPAGRSKTAYPLSADSRHGWGGDLVAMIFQEEAEAALQPDAFQPGQPNANQQPVEPGQAPEEDGGPLGDLQIEILPGGVLVIRGRERDVRRVMEIIRQIEQSTPRPEVEVYPLQYIDSQAVAELISPIYEEFFAPLQGALSITALDRPNAVLLIGSAERIELVKALLAKLDQPVLPTSQMQVFRLRHASAVDVEQTVRDFFVERPGVGTDLRTGLGTRVRIISDYRTNSLIVQAAPVDLQEVALLVSRIDVPETLAANEVRVFPLRNTLASDLAPVLQAAVSGQALQPTPGQQQQPGQAAAAQQNVTPPSSRLQIIGIDREGNKIINSGILTDVAITPDVNLNALVVTAPADSMDLIAELIRQLDLLPAAESQIKVFTIINGDATTLMGMLQQLFGQQVTAGQGALGQAFGRALTQAVTGLPALGPTVAGEEGALIPLRFASDPRTNSIIVSGSAAVLNVVEAILVRLDAEELRQREITVYRLQNAPAAFVAEALNELLLLELQNQQQQLQQAQLFLTNPLEFFEQRVFVVPEEISNSLVISAASPYLEEVMAVIRELDRRPPMVMIQVVIAEVTLDATKELGVELGIQDSLLFDRGLNTIGFNFIGQPLGEETTPQSLATREDFAGQAFSAFNVGRTSSAAGFPGLVLSANSESINVLIRALQAEGKMQVLSRPQIMTMDNIPASILVGQRVPRITDTSVTNTGTISSTTLDEIGLRLGIIPRVTPDGLVVMDLEASKSSVGAIEQGIPIAVQDGVVINSPIFNDTTAITTISARSGQTVVFAGLISKQKSTVFRGVPYLSDIPVLGRLFRFDSTTEERSELLIFLTPHIVFSDSPEDIDRMNLLESERMSWCLADVVELHGPVNLSGGRGAWGPADTPVIFPDLDPTAGELVPTPAPSPFSAPPAAGFPPEPPMLNGPPGGLPLEQSSRRPQGLLTSPETAMVPPPLHQQPLPYAHPGPGTYDSAPINYQQPVARPLRLPAVQGQP